MIQIVKKLKNIFEDSEFQMNWISKCRNEIYGISMLWIMLYHANNCKVDWSLYKLPFLKLGWNGVEVFVFLSGICLFFSFQKDHDEYHFIKKRILRLVPAVISISGFFWVGNLLNGSYDIWLTILRFTTIDFWFTYRRQIWFISFILLCYLLYPYIDGYFYSRNNKNVLLRTIVMFSLYTLFLLSLEKAATDVYKGVEIALARFPAFILGCACGRAVYKNRKIKLIPVLLLSTVGMIFYLYTYYHRIFSGALSRIVALSISLPIVFWAAFLLHFLKEQNYIRKFLSFFGKYSLEFYLSHLMWIKIYTEWDQSVLPYHEKSLKRFLLVLLVSIIYAVVITKIVNAIRTILKRNQQKNH